MSRLNLISLVGIVVLLLIAFICSNNKKKIKWRIVGIGSVLSLRSSSHS